MAAAGFVEPHVDAYGKRITTTVPRRNDGAQIKGQQSSNGPVVISATGGAMANVKAYSSGSPVGRRRTSARRSSSSSPFRQPAW